MKYMLLVYDNPASWTDVTEEQMKGLYAEYAAVSNDPATVSSAQLAPVDRAKTIRVRERRDADDGRPVRGDEGAPRRLLPRRGRLDRRRGRDRGAHPVGPHGRLGRGAPADRDVAMQYLLLIYSDEADLGVPLRARRGRRSTASTAASTATCVHRRSSSPATSSSRLRQPRACRCERRHDRQRRPVRRDEGGARWLLPDRGGQPRRGDRVGGADPLRPPGNDRDPADRRSLGRRLVDELVRAYRDERARSIAILARVLGDLDLAEDAVQDAFATAVERWPRDGAPANPGAWIVATARNRAIDRIRREQTLARKTELLARLQELAPPSSEDEEAGDARRAARADLHLLPPRARARRRRWR